MKQLLMILLAIVSLSCTQKNESRTINIDLKEDIVTPKFYVAVKNRNTIHIDGKANESVWQQAQFSDPFIDIEGVKIPRYKTQMKMLWDEDYLYVYAQMQEPHIWGNLSRRDTVIFYNNDFEVFISPSGTTYNYGEIEINSLGTVWDLMLDRPYRDHGKANNHWNMDKLKTAIHIEGTLNKHSDIDTMWSVEMAIPMVALRELGGPEPEENAQWRINFSRVEWDFDIINGRYDRKKDSEGKYLPEYNWVWSPQKVINMHEPEKWGFLQFTEKSSSDEIVFIEDKDLQTKQIAYALFRKTKRGELNDLMEIKVGGHVNLDLVCDEKKMMKAIFFKTHFGYEFKIESKGHSFIINESGQLKEIK